MKVKKLLIVGTSLLMLLAQTKVNAYTEYPLKEEANSFTKSIEANLSEEDEVVELLNHNIVINSNTYTVATIEKTKNEDETKQVSEQKKETLKSKEQNYIKKYFGEKYDYKDEEGYSGNIPISHININTISHGKYQELREKKIEFNKYSQNDLNNIKKEITEGNDTYYLINVDWQIEDTEVIDNQEVPKTYKGTMIYQTVVEINNPNEYEITVTYTGDVSKENTEYTYKAMYNKVVNKPIEEPQIKEENNIVPVIIISGIGIGLAVLIFLLSNGNAVIYNKTDSGYRVLKSFKLSKEQKNIIDISKYNYKINSNMYSLKLKKSIYEKLKGKIVYVKIENISKPVTINSRYIEFII